MMIKQVFIIVPSLELQSPIKGAAALGNALTKWVSVTFVTLKGNHNNFHLLNKKIKILSLSEYKWHEKLQILRKQFKLFKNYKTVATISFGLSADFLNSFCTNNVGITCASVRGNLPVNYYYDHGFIGKWIAYFHLKRLRKIGYVVSMTSSMSNQVQKYTGKLSPVVCNFINESSLTKFKKTGINKGQYKFVFTGSLSNRKQPLILVEAISTFVEQKEDFFLDIFGDGPLMNIMQEKVNVLQCDDKVKFHGFVNEPYRYISEADVLVLPSLSEGVPRSALEALYLGIPCVLRDVDGNSELIEQGVNGFLFKNDIDLAPSMINAVKLSRDRNKVTSLLPHSFTQYKSAKKYLELMEPNK